MEAAKRFGGKPSPQGKTACRRGYNYQWQKARAAYLAEHPLCVECERKGIVKPATTVDHKIPHRGNQQLFWDVTNWQPLCAVCHGIKSEKEGR